MKLSQISDEITKQSDWIDELVRWEKKNPTYQPFKEDSDSQRQTAHERRLERSSHRHQLGRLRA